MGARASALLTREDSRLEISTSLVNAARCGDREALATLVSAVWPDAYRLARSMLGDSAAAEDTAQDACARALSAVHTLRRPESFATWFCRIVVNEAKQRLLTTARELSMQTGLRDARHRTSEDAGGQDDRIDVRRAIEALQPVLRLTVVLHYYFGMSSAEIARIADTSPVTARWRLMVAHRKLRALLGPGRAGAGPTIRRAEELCG